MQDFVYHAPDSLAGVQALLEEHGEEARLLAGGTGLLNMMGQNLVSADILVSLHRVPGLNYIRKENGDLHVGALTTQRDMETSPVVQEHASLLTDTYKRVATVRIRNMATVGGGLAHGDPSQDPPSSLLVLGAQVKLSSSKGDRVIPFKELLRDYYDTAVEPGEVITELIVPPAPAGARTHYIKFLPRTEDDYPTVSVAALGRVEGGAIQDVRVALGAVSNTSVLSSAIPAVLMGKAPTREALREAAEGVADEVDPISDVRGSSDYKRAMAVVFARRALENVFGVNA